MTRLNGRNLLKEGRSGKHLSFRRAAPFESF